MKLKPKQVKKIVGRPEKAAEIVDLVYTTEDQLTIRRKKHGRGFMYFEKDVKIKDPKRLQRFKDLVIPPAWEEVRIAPDLNAHLQVIGKDSKGRTQYRYHPHWNKIRNSTKFYRMLAFGEVLSKIRAQVQKDLKQTQLNRSKVLALVISLMEETHIRIGNNYYAQKNKSYGLTTMRDKHVKQTEEGIKFEFLGKKGVEHSVELHDKKLRKLVLQCEEIPGWELFQYYDENGEHHQIDSGMVNTYIQEITGADFTAKDFRTWAASKIFLQNLIDFEQPDTPKQRNQNIVQACKNAAKELGNSPTVCRKYYIHPGLIEKYEADESFADIKLKNLPAGIKNLDQTEKIMLSLIEHYVFDLEND